ncbi:S-adenosyl-L-methionine-dependent methyltransferase [Hypomontagnella submonticulosa]|nr:S-adenosyl-L-methionine-dependent methyltransferase [Hypomontagnella submonticulosa]
MSSAADNHNPSRTPDNVKERLKSSYDAIAPKYNAWTAQHSGSRLKYLEKLFELLSAPGPSQQPHFLELGCGAGEPVTRKLLSYPGVHVTANDLSTTQIELAKSSLLGDGNDNAANAGRLTLIERDMMNLSFPDQSFDAVFAFYSLIHLPRVEQTEMIGKIVRWLKPGGYLLANFAEGEQEVIVMEKWLDEKDWMFWSGWGKDKTLKVVEDAGLEIVVSEVSKDVVDASFLWIIAKR